MANTYRVKKLDSSAMAALISEAFRLGNNADEKTESKDDLRQKLGSQLQKLLTIYYRLHKKYC